MIFRTGSRSVSQCLFDLFWPFRVMPWPLILFALIGLIEAAFSSCATARIMPSLGKL